MPHIHIPSSLQSLTDGAQAVQVNGATVGEALIEFSRKYPKMLDAKQLENGKLPLYLGVSVDGKDIRILKGLETPVVSTSAIFFVMPLSGG